MKLNTTEVPLTACFCSDLFSSHVINALHFLQMTNYSLEQSLFTLTKLDGAQRLSMGLVETQSLAPKYRAEGLSLLTSFAMLMVRRQLPSYMEHGLSEFPKGGKRNKKQRQLINGFAYYSPGLVCTGSLRT